MSGSAGRTHEKTRRGMGPFSSFAASFSGLSVMTGLFQVWFIGYAFGGPGFIWFWPIVFIGQMAVALVFAEMAARFPYAGAAYQWARHLGGREWGWLTGWTYLLAQLVTLPAAVVAMQLTLPALWSGFNISDDFAKNSVILGMITLVIVTIVNIAGVRLMSLVNNVGVVAEIGGALFLIVMLATHLHHGPSQLSRPMAPAPATRGATSAPSSCAASWRCTTCMPSTPRPRCPRRPRTQPGPLLAP